MAIDRSGCPTDPKGRISWLKAEASSLLSEARDIEMQQPFPLDHGCIVCEECRMKVLADEVKRAKHDDPNGWRLG